MEIIEHEPKCSDVNEQDPYHQYTYNNHVRPYDPNLSSAARYSPPYTTNGNSQSDCDVSYSNVIFVPNGTDPENSVGSRMLDSPQTYILSSNSRILNTFVRDVNDETTVQSTATTNSMPYVNESEILTSRDLVVGGGGGAQTIIHHPNIEEYHNVNSVNNSVTYLSSGNNDNNKNESDNVQTAQIIVHRTTTANRRFFQQLQNGLLNGNNNAVELVSGLHPIDTMNSYGHHHQFQNYENSDNVENCLIDQTDDMIVVNNDAERIELLVSNELSTYSYKNQNHQNLLIEQNNSDYAIIDNSNNLLHSHHEAQIVAQQHHENELMSLDTMGNDITIADSRAQERLLLQSSMSPLLAAVNDITSREDPGSLPSFLTHHQSKSLNKSNAHELYSNNNNNSNRNNNNNSNDIITNHSNSSLSLDDNDLNDGKILLDFSASVANSRELAYKNSLKIVNIRSLAGDNDNEYVDINDVKSINLIDFQNDNRDDFNSNFDDEEINNSNNKRKLSKVNIGIRKSQRKLKKEICLMVADKHVPCRAWASLPTGYLYIGKSPKNSAEYSVFSKKDIPLRTKFGPLEGDLRVIENDDHHLIQIKLQNSGYPILFVEGNKLLETSNENTSNWMRFVRFADNFLQQNLLLFECNGKLYFKSCQFIRSKQELKVGYSREYAEKYNLPILQPNDQERKELIENKNQWPCYECEKKFSTSEDLQKHLNEHDEDEDDDNDDGETINKNGTLKKKKIFRNKSLHNKTNKPNERTACPICQKTFFKMLSLKRHMQTHSATHPLVEKSIDFGNNKINNTMTRKTIGKEQLNLKNGPISSKSITNNNKENKNDIYRFKCDLCPKAFPSAERLTRHTLVHSSNETKPLQCPHCPKRFLTSSALAVHVKIHLFSQRFLHCPMCLEQFKYGSTFKTHVRSHLENGLYHCKHCNKKFKEYKTIRKHIRTFHSEIKHPCQECGKQFPALNKLRMHLLKHSDHREFLCSECGKQFKRKDKLREHVKRLHSDEKKLLNETDQIKDENNGSDQKNSSQESSPKQGISGDEMNDIKRMKNNGSINENKTENSMDEVTTSGCFKKTKFSPKVSPSDYQRFIYKCHDCLLGFKRRGMLVNHLAKRHPTVRIDSVPELNLPILKAQKFYYCQYCEKVYKSNSKRKAHILKYHPGLELPMSSRYKGGISDIPGYPNPTYSQTVGSITTHPQGCAWCHKQYASKAKLLQHQRKKHPEHIKEIEMSAQTHSISAMLDATKSINPHDHHHHHHSYSDSPMTVNDYENSPHYDDNPHMSVIDYENYSPESVENATAFLAASSSSSTNDSNKIIDFDVSSDPKVLKILMERQEIRHQQQQQQHHNTISGLSKIDINLKVIGNRNDFGESSNGINSAGGNSSDSNGCLPHLFEEIDYMELKPVILATDIVDRSSIRQSISGSGGGSNKLGNNNYGYPQSAG